MLAEKVSGRRERSVFYLNNYALSPVLRNFQVHNYAMAGCIPRATPPSPLTKPLPLPFLIYFE